MNGTQLNLSEKDQKWLALKGGLSFDAGNNLLDAEKCGSNFTGY